jgi:Tfp pilus assembly protein PilO
MNTDWTLENYFQKKFVSRFRGIYQQKKVKTYSGSILTLLTISFFIFFAITPTLKTITRLYRETNDKQEVLQKLEDKVDSLTTAERQLVVIAPDLNLVNQALPKDSEIILLSKQIEALGRRVGQSYQGINYNSVLLKGTTSTTQNMIDFDLSLKGDYNGLVNYLTTLNQLNRIILVDSFSLSKEVLNNQEGLSPEQSNQLILAIKAKAYFLKEQGE